MTAAEWLAAARASGINVYLDPRPDFQRSFYMSRPVPTPGLLEPQPYHPQCWPAIDADLERVGRRAVFDELHREGAWRSSPVL